MADLTTLTATTALASGDLMYVVDGANSRKITWANVLNQLEAQGAAPTSFITSGTFADARIAASNVTQHQAALSITESQVSDLGTYLTAAASATLTNKTIDGDSNTISNLDIGNEVDWPTAGDVTDRTAFASGDKLLIQEAGVGLRKIDYDDLPGAGGGLSNVVEDTTPQLGGDLDVNGNDLVSTSNGDITLTPNGTGNVILGTFTLNADATVGAGQDNYVLTYDHSAGTWGPEASAGGGSGDVSKVGTPSNNQIGVWTGDGTIEGDSDLSWNGTSLEITGDIVLNERADHGFTPAAGHGIVWVSNDATQKLYFTDDAGTDNEVLTSGSGSTLTDTAAATADHVPYFDNSDSDNPKVADIAQILKLKPEHIMVAVSDETTALTTGTAKITFRMPYAFTLTDVRASVTTAPTGSALTVDINEGGTTILSTKLTIDATETTSETAATAAVISDSALADDAQITIDIDAVGSTVAGAGLKVTLIGTQT